MRVDRCVCHNLTFESLKSIRDREGLDFEGLRARTRCATGCRLCEPYIRLMIESGRTAFPVLSDGEVRDIMARSRARTAPPDAPGANHR